MLSNISKLIIYSIFITSTMMVISSTNLFMIWVSLELNLFSFMPILLYSSSNNEMEASINYFLAQILGSSLFLLSSTILLNSYWPMKTSIALMWISILLKMGAVPCHYWYPVTMEMSSWMNCLILSTWQKMAPLIILAYIVSLNTRPLMMYMVSSMNTIIGGVMGLSQTSIKKIMAYSSITHMGWMLSALITNTPQLSIMYLIIYALLTLPLFSLFNYTSTIKVNDLWDKQKMPMSMKMTTSILLLSLGGLPPLTGFIPKLLIINNLMKYSIMPVMLLIFGSLMNLFFYLNISLNMMMNNQTNKMKPMNMTITNSTINTMIALNSLTLLITML